MILIAENLLKCLPGPCHYKLINSNVASVVGSVAEWLRQPTGSKSDSNHG